MIGQSCTKLILSALALAILAGAVIAPLKAQQAYVNVCAPLPGNGTRLFPYNTLTRAVAEAPAGTTLTVQGGSYPERLTIKKDLIITAPSGPVIVGGYFVGTQEICVPITEQQGTFDDGRLVSCASDPPGVRAKLYYPASAQGAGPMACGGPFPLVVYAHGRRFGSEDLCDWSVPGPLHEDYRQAEVILTRLAASGFIVISVDVTWGLHEDAKAGIVLNTLAYARDKNARSGSLLKGAVNLYRVGFAGHSTGGTAAVLAARCLTPGHGCLPGLDLGGIRIAALGLLAPGLITDEITEVDAALLVIHGTNDTLQVGDAPLDIYGLAARPKHLVVVTGANHFGYTDNICLDPGDGRDAPSSVGGVTGPGAHRRQQLTGRNYLEAFFSRYLRGDSTKLDYLIQEIGQQCEHPGDPPACGPPRRRFDELNQLSVSVSVCSCIN